MSSPIVVAVIAAVASVIAAALAGVFATAARRDEVRLQRANQSFERIAETKRAMYEPVVRLLDRMFTSDEVPTPEELEHKREFDTWVNVYASDGVIRAYSRFIMALPHQPPADIQFRLYADFLLEIRNDVGHPDSTITRMDVLAGRTGNLSDLSSLTEPKLDVVCKRLAWTPPWS
jgi:hypothetical protein